MFRAAAPMEMAGEEPRTGYSRAVRWFHRDCISESGRLLFSCQKFSLVRQRRWNSLSEVSNEALAAESAGVMSMGIARQRKPPSV